MNGVMQQQNASQHIAGVIQNFRKVSTRTGKPMAVFTIGTTAAKCFDLMVGTAEQWAGTGKNVSISGYFSEHSGQSELVVQTISPLPQGPGGQGQPPGTAINQNAAGPAIDNRPDQPSMEVTENYIVITIPRGATPEQLDRITGVAKEAVRDLETQVGRGITELTQVCVMTTDPATETGDIQF